MVIFLKIFLFVLAFSIFNIIVSVDKSWRNNEYIRENGILPYQRCNSLDVFPGAKPLISDFQYLGKQYWLIISAVSVWGTSLKDGKPKEVRHFELLTFYKEKGRSCDKDNGHHCIPDISMPKNIFISCTFVNEYQETLHNSNGSIYAVEPKGNTITSPLNPTAVSIICPFHSTDILLNNNKILLKLNIGDKVNNTNFQTTVDVCYQQITKIEEAVVCTSPMFGFPKLSKNNHNDKFSNSSNNNYWLGKPLYHKHTLLDTFLSYYVILMNIRVAVYEYDNENLKNYLFERYQEYLKEGNSTTKIYYRTNWNFEEIQNNSDNDALLFTKGTTNFVNEKKLNAMKYLYEEFSTISCQWENRILAKWFFIFGADNYIIPYENKKSIIDVIRNINSSITGALIPMYYSCENKSSSSKGNYNALIRWNNGTASANRGYIRVVPIGNPRDIQYTNIHYMSGLYPWAKNIVSPDDSKVIGLKNIHLWGLIKRQTSPQGCKHDPWFNEIAESVQNILLNNTNNNFFIEEVLHKKNIIQKEKSPLDKLLLYWKSQYFKFIKLLL